MLEGWFDMPKTPKIAPRLNGTPEIRYVRAQIFPAWHDTTPSCALATIARFTATAQDHGLGHPFGKGRPSACRSALRLLVRKFASMKTTELLNSFVANESLTKRENKCVNPGRIGLSRLLSLENPTQRPDNQPTVSVNTYLVTALC